MKKDTTVHFNIPVDADEGELHWIAAAPADHRTAFAGSGLPFPTRWAAEARTPNSGVVRGVPGQPVTVHMYFPNSYMENGVKVPPSVRLAWQAGGAWQRSILPVGPSIPHRSLTYHPRRTGAMFYDGTHELPIRGQERVLRDGAYPAANTEPWDGWGLRPRL